MTLMTRFAAQICMKSTRSARSSHWRMQTILVIQCSVCCCQLRRVVVLWCSSNERVSEKVGGRFVMALHHDVLTRLSLLPNRAMFIRLHFSPCGAFRLDRRLVFNCLRSDCVAISPRGTPAFIPQYHLNAHDALADSAPCADKQSLTTASEII